MSDTDEITRLRAENQRLEDENKAVLAANRDVMLHWDVLKADYERLRAALKPFVCDCEGEAICIGECMHRNARAALDGQPAPSEWRPINIHPVPRDGSRFAICRAGDPDSIECGRYDPLISFEYEPADGGLYKKTERVGYEWSGLNNMERATHWLPLPPTPGKEVK